MRYLLILLALLALSCTGTKKEVAGGTSEETNTLALLPVVGVDGSATALAFRDPSGYLASMEYGGRFSAVASFKISAWLKIDSLPGKSAIPHNLIGKFSDNSAVLPSEFSLAIVNGTCGAEAPTFAFFFTDESSNINCGHALLSKNPIKAGNWIFVEANWDGRYLVLYQDGILVAKEERISASLPYSRLPVYLGKSQVPFAIDGLSFNTEDSR
ncbi:MAG: LamG domain-containing protein [Fibromonadales bacterium]|nr:LamG domain-containing protein [Fibromonadales bacterium]